MICVVWCFGGPHGPKSWNRACFQFHRQFITHEHRRAQPRHTTLVIRLIRQYSSRRPFGMRRLKPQLVKPTGHGRMVQPSLLLPCHAYLPYHQIVLEGECCATGRLQLRVLYNWILQLFSYSYSVQFSTVDPQNLSFVL